MFEGELSVVCWGRNSPSSSSSEKNSKIAIELKKEKREKEKLQKELEQKEKAMAEAAAILVLKKGECNLGDGQRGRLISAQDREYAVELISEAVDDGARQRLNGPYQRTVH